jgi:nucleoside-triphosphatase
MGQALLLTGRPGVGKTTVIRRVVAGLGTGAGGFYTDEIREHERRTGFRLVTLDGEAGILAGVNISSPHRVGRYKVDLDDLEQVGVKAVLRAVEQRDVALVVIDEIGKMELLSAAFCEAVLAALESPKAVLATVMARPQPWVDGIKARPEVTLIEVTRSNREAVPEQILRWVRQTQGETVP